MSVAISRRTRRLAGQLYRLLNYPRQAILRSQINDPESFRRFELIRNEYSNIFQRLIDAWELPSINGKSNLYDWTSWSATVYKSFVDGIPRRFLAYPVIAHTMVYGSSGNAKACRDRASFVSEVFGKEIANLLLREDAVGGPMIDDLKWMTSANRAHHAGHLARYFQARNYDFTEIDSILEWGGGYGDMAVIVKRRNPDCTYLILDLNELLALQYVYLAAILGEAAVHLVTPDLPPQSGKINLVPSMAVITGKMSLRCSGFLSTWALNESPADAQKFVADNNYFGASKILLAYAKNDDNVLSKNLGCLGIEEYPDPFLGINDRYAFL